VAVSSTLRMVLSNTAVPLEQSLSLLMLRNK